MLDGEARDALEREIRRRCETGDRQQAATLLLEGYGREILGFLTSRLADHDAASEVFSRFTEDLWRGLARFRWQCSARVWCYTLARHAASQHIRELRRRRRHHVPLSRGGTPSELRADSRTATPPSARTESKRLITRLRERLSPNDQMLLILRINRCLSWSEVAQVMFHEGEVVSESVLAREATRLRKRYEVAKQKLRAMAEAEGLLPSQS